MARKKTRKQKIKSRNRLPKQVAVNVSETGQVSVSLDQKIEGAKKTKATTFSQSQVSLLHRDLLKTLITTAIVFGVLILVYFSSL